jgi:lysyl-tRNA synthetase class 1
MEYFAKELKDEYDEKKLKLRIECAENWLKKYAPEDFKFEVQKSSPEDLSLMPKQKDAVSEVIRILDSDKEFNEESLTAELFEVPKKVGMDGKEFFGIMYKILISRTRGPKLAPFILTIGRERVCALLKQAME